LLERKHNYFAGKKRRTSLHRQLPVLAILLLAFFNQGTGAVAQSSELAGIAALVQQGRFAEAEHQLQRYLAKSPHAVKANELLGEVYIGEGHPERAEEVLKKAIAAAPGLTEPRMDLGDAYVAEGKLDSATAAFEGARKISPHNARANVALARLYLSAGEFAKSIEAAGSIPVEKRTAELLPTLAADYSGLHQPEKAGLEIQGILQVAPKQPELVPELAEFFLAHGDAKSSQQLLTLAQAKQQPVTERFSIVLARTQAGLGQLAEAQKTLEGVLEHSPQSVNALVAAGQVAAKQLDYAASAEAFTLADKLAPQRPDILYGLASAELYANRPGDALENAQKLHASVPDDLRSTYVLALALFGVKKWEEAKPFAEQVLAAHPDDREMNLVLVDIALNDEHDVPLARKHIEACLKLNPDDPGALYYLGTIQKMEGDVTAAVQSFSRSVSANPKNADAQGALGSLSLQAGDAPRAVRALEQAVLLAPEEIQNHYQLALAYSRLGMSDKAKAQLEIYQQMKAKEVKDAKDSKGPATSEVPPVGMSSPP
jgi:tetratricopeptide (TPR) repeat protein